MKLQTYLSALRKCEREYVDYALSQYKPCAKFLARRERLADKLEKRIIHMYDSLDRALCSLDRALSYVVKKEGLGE